MSRPYVNMEHQWWWDQMDDWRGEISGFGYATTANSATGTSRTVGVPAAGMSVSATMGGGSGDPVEQEWTPEHIFMGEPIVGWRVWNLTAHLGDLMSVTALAMHLTKGGSWEEVTYPVLTSVGVAGYWSPRSAVRAHCTRGHLEAPVRGCECGWWAFKEERHALTKAIKSTAHVLGSVSMWDRIVETELGYRSRYAYPRELWVHDRMPPELCEALEKSYGVPVRLGLTEKMNEHHRVLQEAHARQAREYAERMTEEARRMGADAGQKGVSMLTSKELELAQLQVKAMQAGAKQSTFTAMLQQKENRNQRAIAERRNQKWWKRPL